ncbi:MAG: hypothetical protein H0W15_09885 [Gemmatimonadales bacterium]|nr:hypothetical protein [Gemmatimonadales bacterium]
MARASTMFAAAAFLAACGAGDRDAAPVDSASPSVAVVDSMPPIAVMSGNGVGCFQIGMSVPSASGACPALADTVVQGPEGMMVRELRSGADDGGLVAWIEADTVRRVVVTDLRWRTVDSLGVGTELDALLARPGATAIEGEGRLFVTLPTHCGLSFRLAARRGAAVESIDELVRTVLQRNTLVDQVLVFGCPA